MLELPLKFQLNMHLPNMSEEQPKPVHSPEPSSWTALLHFSLFLETLQHFSNYYRIMILLLLLLHELKNFTSVAYSARNPHKRIAQPVIVKGRVNPPTSYKKAPTTGPIVSPKLNAASHHAFKT